MTCPRHVRRYSFRSAMLRDVLYSNLPFEKRKRVHEAAPHVTLPRWAALLLRDALLRAKAPTIAYVHPRAISAGALISLATDAIVVADGSPRFRHRSILFEIFVSGCRHGAEFSFRPRTLDRY